MTPWGRYRFIGCGVSLLLLLLCLSPAGRTADAAVAAVDFRLLVEQASSARYRSPAEARALNRSLRELLAASPDPAIAARSYLTDCWTLIEQDGKQASAAAALGLRSLAPLAEAGARVLRTRLELCDFTAREYLGEIKDALSGYDRLVSQAEQLGDALLLAEARHARGELRGYVGRFSEGLEDVQYSCRAYREVGLEDESLSCLQSIAVIYYRLKDHDRAIEYMNEVVGARTARGQTYMLAEGVFNLARALEGKGDTAAARQRYEQMLSLSGELEDPTGVAYAEQALGELLTRQRQAARGLELLDSALLTFRRIQDTDMSARVLQKRGNALLQLQRFPEAIASLQESVGLYRKIDNNPGLESTYRLLGKVLLRTGQFEGAAAALLAEREVHEELDRVRRDDSLAQQRAQFEAEKREEVNRRLEAQRALADSTLQSAMRIDRLKTAVLVLSTLLLSAAGVFLLRQLRLSARLRALALSDELTGIGNRRSVLTFLDEQIRLHRASGKPLSVALLDIDKFKQLNDEHGHAAGDEALKAVANLCQLAMRGNDKIGRTGGEEFLAVLPDATLEHAGEVAGRLCDQVRGLALDQVAPGLRTSVSLGVSAWHPDDPDAQAVVKRADEALYRAKADGRDCVRLAAG